jgi:ABC-2 type transport system ATP-binding protein
VSRRDFWDQIHRIAAEGTTVLVTTHYMDEAERCHRLAFIFRGELLAVGTPAEIVAQRALYVVELELAASDAVRAEAALQLLDGVEEVSHFGHVTRIALREQRNAECARSNVLDALTGISITPERCELGRATVEDAFVSMVRQDDRLRANADALAQTKQVTG